VLFVAVIADNVAPICAVYGGLNGNAPYQGSSFLEQAMNAYNNASSAFSRVFLVLLGHNDYCTCALQSFCSRSQSSFFRFRSGLAQKVNTDCSQYPDGADRDPNMYCTIKPSAFQAALS